LNQGEVHYSRRYNFDQYGFLAEQNVCELRLKYLSTRVYWCQHSGCHQYN